MTPPKTFFETINTLFSSFIWSNKAHRLSRKLLQNNRKKGGLNFPNLELNYYSAQAYYINTIINRSEEDTWVNIEGHQLRGKNLFIAFFTKGKIQNVSFGSKDHMPVE